MNTSYGIGDVFAHAVESGATLADAVKKEVAMIQSIYNTPVKAQAKLMDSVGQSSFDCRKYMKDYRTKMTGAVKAAIDDDVHYGNIVTVPAYCVGDIAHHIAQSTYNMCKDDVIMAVIESVTEVMDKTLHAAARRSRPKTRCSRLRPGHPRAPPVPCSNWTASTRSWS